MHHARTLNPLPVLSSTNPWRPSRLGPVLWYEADTLITAPGNAIANVGNLGSLGSAGDSAQGTGANQPTWSSTGGPNGTRPAIVHTSPRFLLTPHNAAWKTAQLTWWIALKYDSITAFQTALNSSDQTNWNKGFGVLKANSTGGNSDCEVWASDYAANLVNFTTLGTTNWHLVVGRYDGTAVKGRRNGVAGVDDAFAGPIVHGTGPLVIGSSVSVPATPTYAYNLEGRWVSAGVIGRSISDTDCSRLETWISRKWGFALT